MDHTEANSSAAWHLEFGVGRSLTLRPFVQFTHDQLGRLLNSVLATVFSQELHEISSLATIKSNEPSIMRVVKYSPEFSISFNLMNGASEDLITDWAIDDAVKEWMTPLLNRIPSKFHYYTQVSIQ
jgi:hypothetical protein